MKKYHLQKMVLIPLSLTLLVLISAFIMASYHISQQDEATFMASRHQHFRSVFAGLAARDSQAMLVAAEFIGAQEKFQQAMLEKNIGRLQYHGHDVFTQLQESLQISLFYFRDPQGEVLLRVYRPEDFSPGLIRSSLERAMVTGLPSAGLEIGRSGFLAQRLYYPWKIEGQLIGYIELGIEIMPMIRQIKEITDSDIIIAIDKRHLEMELWEAAHVNHTNEKRWSLLDAAVICETTLNLPAKDLIEMYHASSNAGRIESADSRIFRLGRFPLMDAGQQQIGTLLMVVDVTGRAANFRSFMARVSGFSLLLSAALFVFAFKILGRVSRQLRQKEDQLQKTNKIILKNNALLNSEIRKREYTQQELLELNQSLEQRVSNRTNELARKNLELENHRQSLEKAYKELKDQQATILHQDKMACIGQLAAGVAHDINNPIGFVSHNIKTLERYYERLHQFYTLNIEMIRRRGDAELMAACLKGRADFGIEKILEEIPVMLAECHDGTTRISQTVQSLRTFSRSEIPKHELTDLHQCLESTLAILRHELRDKITIERHYGDIPKRYCYTGQINQVLLNLLINATQAIDEQGKIRIDTWAENENIYISINDNGCGIPPNALEKIFEPFFTTKEAGVGTGLGMSIVLDIITNHKGAIDVTSQVGVGTTVVICLPFDERSRPRTQTIADHEEDFLEQERRSA